MRTALREISRLRGESNFEIDPRNSNRYRVLIKEKLGTTAYCFGTPIYNWESRKLVARRFEPHGDAFIFTGSNATVTAFKHRIVLKNTEGSMSIDLPTKKIVSENDGLTVGEWDICPTFNGITVSVPFSSVKLTLRIDRPFSQVRHCSKCFSIMQEEFRPFLSLSPLMAVDEQNGVCPAVVEYNQTDALTYEVKVSAAACRSVQFELNLYEPKLFQDTTVDRTHPDENNAFGGIAFLGRTKWFGEQWLYTRPDFSRLAELYSVKVKKVLLHLPCMYSTGTKLSVFAPTARFCSFGFTWNSQIGQTEQLAAVQASNGYVTIDLTHMLTEPLEQQLLYTEGLILKPCGTESGFTAIATGDHYGFPQILEVQYN